MTTPSKSPTGEGVTLISSLRRAWGGEGMGKGDCRSHSGAGGGALKTPIFNNSVSSVSDPQLLAQVLKQNLPPRATGQGQNFTWTLGFG